jgi:hypothetical protein
LAAELSAASEADSFFVEKTGKQVLVGLLRLGER